MHAIHPTRTSGFSLLEISIVLVLAGLLTGAIIGGKSMIHQSKLQSIVSDFSRYNDAYKRFLTQYGGKPGDLGGLTGSPTSIWGSAGGTGSDAACFAALGTIGNQATCNGDGNNFIAGSYLAGALTKPEEIYTAIQQLSNAKLIEGKYTGVRDAVAGTIAGINVPSGPLENSGYAFLTIQPITATNAADAPNYFHGNYGTAIIFGGTDVNGINQILSPKDTLVIDSKMDDGLPAMGSIVTYLQYPNGQPTAINNSCVTAAGVLPNAASDRNAVYNVSVKEKLCNIAYVIDTK
jgi:hypothetical protein